VSFIWVGEAGRSGAAHQLTTIGGGKYIVATSYRYVIVGGGMAADAAVRGIRRHDADGSILMVSAESFPPYDRPPLSKALWKKGGKVENVWRALDYARLGVQLRLGLTVSELDATHHHIVTEDGQRIGYERLLLATGGAPRELAGHPPGPVYFRTARDYFALRRDILSGHEVAVIGGGFIGAEMAAALTLAGKHVHLVFPEAGVLGRVLPAALSQAVTDDYRERGVSVHSGHQVKSIRVFDEDRWAVTSDQGEEWIVTAVVAGLGIVPRVELMTAQGVACADGIEVDAEGRTALPDVYAAGDVANFYSPALRRRLRVEHEDHANRHGETVGENMAGAPSPYHHLPFFYSDLFDLGFEAVGVVDSRLGVVEDWLVPNQRGAVFYIEEDRVVGVLCCDVWDQMDKARALIAEGLPVGDGSHLKGFLTGQG